MDVKKIYSPLFTEAWQIFKDYASLSPEEFTDVKWGEFVGRCDELARKSEFAHGLEKAVLNEVQRLYTERRLKDGN